MGGVKLQVTWHCKECGAPYLAKNAKVRDGMCEMCYRREYARLRARRQAAAELGVASLKAAAVCEVCGEGFTYIVRRFLGLEAPRLCQRHRRREMNGRIRAEPARMGPDKREAERPPAMMTMKGIPLGLYGVIHNPLNHWDCRVMDLRDLWKLIQEDEIPIGMELMDRKGLVGIRVEVDGLRRMGQEEIRRRMEVWDDDDQTGEDGATDEADEAVGMPGGACAGAGGDQRQRAQPIAFVPASD